MRGGRGQKRGLRKVLRREEMKAKKGTGSHKEENQGEKLGGIEGDRDETQGNGVDEEG